VHPARTDSSPILPRDSAHCNGRSILRPTVLPSCRWSQRQLCGTQMTSPQPLCGTGWGLDSGSTYLTARRDENSPSNVEVCEELLKDEDSDVPRSCCS
jgi:hypothetical protein